MNTVAGILASGAALVAAYYLGGMVEYLAGASTVVIFLGLTFGTAAAFAVWFGCFYLFCRLLDGR